MESVVGVKGRVEGRGSGSGHEVSVVVDVACLVAGGEAVREEEVEELVFPV